MSYGTYHLLDDVKKSNKEWLQRSAIATIINIHMIPLLHDHFVKEGVLSSKAIPLGGSFILLNFENQETMESFLSNDVTLLKSWFTDIKPYSLTFAQNKRLAWFRLVGVALHAWSSHFFKWFSEKMDMFVAIDSSINSKSKMGVARILVIVDNLRSFNKIFAVEISNRRYHIFVQDELGGSLSLFNCGTFLGNVAPRYVQFSDNNISCAYSSNADVSSEPSQENILVMDSVGDYAQGENSLHGNLMLRMMTQFQ